MHRQRPHFRRSICKAFCYQVGMGRDHALADFLQFMECRPAQGATLAAEGSEVLIEGLTFAGANVDGSAAGTVGDGTAVATAALDCNERITVRAR